MEHVLLCCAVCDLPCKPSLGHLEIPHTVCVASLLQGLCRKQMNGCSLCCGCWVAVSSLWEESIHVFLVHVDIVAVEDM